MARAPDSHPRPDSPDPTEEQVADLLTDLLEQAPAARRSALADACVRHPELASRLRAAYELSVSLDLGGAAAAPPPTMIGPYRILDTLGSGGMGIVYRAEQLEPVRRQVALKLIKRGMDSDEVLARFALERQTLAIMDHPAIAKVFDAGVSDSGQPYFAMELVSGQPLVRYCDAQGMSIRERIGLFQQVCDGVQHAHHKGALHRDLKPANLLGSRVGDRHTVRIIDFGLARATEQGLGDQSIVTENGMLVGTPEYMSPEQASGRRQDIDTRTDVYSLGVVLYELLSGALPFHSNELRQQPLSEIQRIIAEVEPPPPSARCGDELARTLHGDLDWIVLRAIAKEPELRYESPGALERDLQRYLDDEAVLASPPSTAYRMRKFVRRYRLQVAAAATVLLTIVAGSVAALLLMMAANQARDQAEQNARDTGQVTEILERLFQYASPEATLGKQASIALILDHGRQLIRTELIEQPSIRARMLGRLGRVYYWLGEYEDATALLEEATEVFDTLPETERAVVVRGHHAGALLAQGRLPEALAATQDALARARQIGRPDGVLVQNRRVEFAVALSALERHDEARRILDEVLAVLRPRRDDAAAAALQAALGALGATLVSQGACDAAETVFEEQIQRLRVQYPDGHPLEVMAMANLAEALRRGHRHAAAVVTARETVDEAVQLLSMEHPLTAQVRRTLAGSLVAAGDLAEAREQLELALATFRDRIGSDHMQVAWTANDLALALLKLGDSRAAEPHLRDALRIFEQQVPAGHSYIRIVLGNLGDCLGQHGDVTEARRLLLQASTDAPLANWNDRSMQAGRLQNLAWLEIRSGETASAEKRLLRARELVATNPGVTYERAAVAVWFATLRNFQGRPKQAAEEAEAGIAMLEKVQPIAGLVAVGYYHLGWARFALGQHEAADVATTKSLALYDRLCPDGHVMAAWPHEIRALARDAMHRPVAEFLPDSEATLAIRRRTNPIGSPWRLSAAIRVAQANARLGRFAAARELLASEAPGKLGRAVAVELEQIDRLEVVHRHIAAGAFAAAAAKIEEIRVAAGKIRTGAPWLHIADCEQIRVYEATSEDDAAERLRSAWRRSGK